MNTEHIIITGNTVIDALHWVVNKIHSEQGLRLSLHENIFDFGYDTNRLAQGKRLVLITGHRRENFGEGFLNICHAIQLLSLKYPEVDFVYPVHLKTWTLFPLQAGERGCEHGAQQWRDRLAR